jgi:hypothetical protein
MRRRALLATLASGATVGVTGCLGGDPVIDLQESTRIEAHRGWVQEINGVNGSGSLSYEVRSEDSRFRTYYFTDQESFEYYQNQTLGNGSANQESSDLNEPQGHEDLSKIAVQQDGVFRAAVPDGDGRYSMKIDGTHYFVVDYSNYGMGIQVPDTANPIQVTISVEVVDDYF